MMWRGILAAWIGLGMLLPAVAPAADPVKEALSIIPEDAVGFLCVANLKDLDAKWQQGVTSFGLQPFVQPPFNSPLAMLQFFLKTPQELKLEGPAAVVQMPFQNPMEMNQKTLIVISAADPKVLAESLGGKTGEGGVWSFTFNNVPASGVAAEKRLILGGPESVKAAQGQGNISSKFKPEDLKAFEGQDVILWLDGEKLVKTFKPQIDGLMAMMAMAQAASGPLGVKRAEAAKKTIDMYLEGTKALTVGLAAKPAGVGLRLACSIKPGSELAKLTNVKPPAGSPLQGLPAGRFMLAGGVALNPDAAKETLKHLEPYFDAGKEVKSINAEQLGVLKNLLEEWAPLNLGYRLTVEHLPTGPNGLVGVSVIFETSDSTKWLEMVGKAVGAARQLSSDKEAKEVADAISYTPDAEDLGGVKVAHFKVDLGKIEDLDEDDREEITKVLGKEAVLIRLAPAGPKKVVVGFGGGVEYTKRLLDQAQKEDAPLENTPGIQKVTPHLPAKRIDIGYLAVDEIVACLSEASKVLGDEDEFPFKMPELNAPIGVSSSMAGESSQIDLFVPTEVVVAGKNLVMTMMAGPSGGPGPTEVKLEEKPKGEEKPSLDKKP